MNRLIAVPLLEDLFLYKTCIESKMTQRKFFLECKIGFVDHLYRLNIKLFLNNLAVLQATGSEVVFKRISATSRMSCYHTSGRSLSLTIYSIYHYAVVHSDLNFIDLAWSILKCQRKIEQFYEATLFMLQQKIAMGNGCIPPYSRKHFWKR